MTRKEAREEAFILVFEKEFSDTSLEEILEIDQEVRDIEPDEYMKTAFFGVFDNLSIIDKTISDNAVGWSISRISKTALAILRLAIFEIKFMEDIPVSVSINEAVELAKKYATKEDSSFVNGILATVAKQDAK
ncbi:MAG: transcription antitermination factor NusB [Clostridia bacterium]|nr:transcription antitermination factor NusB [Clostridia bacterium]